MIAPIFSHAKKRPTIEPPSSQGSDPCLDDDLTTPTQLLPDLNERPPKRQKT